MLRERGYGTSCPQPPSISRQYYHSVLPPVSPPNLLLLLPVIDDGTELRVRLLVGLVPLNVLVSLLDGGDGQDAEEGADEGRGLRRAKRVEKKAVWCS